MKTVVRMPGSVLADREALMHLAAQIGALTQLGHRVLVIHGGNCFVSAQLRRIGSAELYEGGLRVVDHTTRDVSVRVLAGQLTKCLAAAVSREGCRVIEISPLDASCFCCETLFRQNVAGKLGYEGYLVGLDRGFIESFWDQGIVLIAACLASTATGEIQCIQPDHMAAACAEYLDADQLLLMSGRDMLPLMCEDVVRLSVDKLSRIFSRRAASARVFVKLEAAKRALDAGIKSVVLVRSDSPHALWNAVVTDRAHSCPPFPASVSNLPRAGI